MSKRSSGKRYDLTDWLDRRLDPILARILLGSFGEQRAVSAYLTTKPRLLIPAIMILIEFNVRSVHDRRRCHHFVCARRPDISASSPYPIPPPTPWILRS